MSGHSKWSKVKHQKATTDEQKGKAFTRAAHGITIAVREGGGPDPMHNFRLRLAIEKAREVNVPKENIERAIEKGKGTSGGAFEEVLYEGFAPGGVALIIEAATDNRQRTGALVKNVLERAGGTLAGPGAVSYLFDHVGVITVPRTIASDTLLIESLDLGARDFVETGDMFEIYTSIPQLSLVKEGIVAKGITVDNTVLVYKPKSTIPVSGVVAQKVGMLITGLEEEEDILTVFSNMYETI